MEFSFTNSILPFKNLEDNDGETYVTLQEEEYIVPHLSHEEEESQGTT